MRSCICVSGCSIFMNKLSNIKNNRMRRRFKGPKFFLFFFLALAGLAAFSGIVMLLWNALMPNIFRLPVIGFWQAAGLLVLSKIFFSGFRGPGGGFGGRWRHKMQQRWMDMTPEERDRFKQEWGRHGGGHGEGRHGGGGRYEGSAPASE
jgi:Ca2+/H+ antiporter, TMEM165/GDT1 family